MNVAFLLMTTAWLSTGQVPPPPPTAPPAPPAATAACGGSCGGCVDPCGCEPFGHRLRAHLRGLFARDCCDTCAPTCAPKCTPAPVCCTPAPVCKPAPVCCTPAPVCKPAPVCCAPAPTTCCQPTCRTFEFHWPKLFHRNDCCQPACSTCVPVKTCAAPACDSCCGGPRFLDRIRAWWNTDNCCSTCSSCGGAAPIAPTPIEPIAPPKKMPTNTTSIPQGPTPNYAPLIQNENLAVPVAPPGGYDGKQY